MAAKKQGTVGKVGNAVKGAASAVVTAANEHVVQPVGHALGLTDEKKKTPAKKKPAAKKVAPKSVAHTTAKKAPAKKMAAKKSTAKKK
jgi:hypothetical protein